MVISFAFVNVFFLLFFCCVAAIFDFVHDVEAIHGNLQFHGHHSYFRKQNPQAVSS